MNRLLLVFVLSALVVANCNLKAQRFLDWGKTFGQQNWEQANALASDDSGNVFVSGDFWIQTDLDPSHDSLIVQIQGFGSDGYIQKLDKDGQLVWGKRIGGNRNDDCTALCVDNAGAGHVYVAGVFSDSIDFDLGPSTNIVKTLVGGNAFLLKLKSNSDFEWVRTFGGFGNESITAIEVDASSNVYTCGLFSDTFDIDPVGTGMIVQSAGDHDAFIQKLDSNGNHQWTLTFGGTGFDNANKISFDQHGNILVIGLFSDTLSISNKNLISNGKQDVYFAKIRPTGTVVWAYSIGGTGADRGTDIVSTLDNNLLVCGDFENRLSLRPNSAQPLVNSNGLKDAFLISVDSNGVFQWGQTWGGANNDLPSAVLMDSSEMIMCLGNFFGQVDFDPGTGSSVGDSKSGEDGFISYFDKRGNFIDFQQFGDNTKTNINKAILTKNDKIVTCGNFENTLDIDPTYRINNQNFNGYIDVFVQQLKSLCITERDTVDAKNCYSYPAPSGKTTWFSSGQYIDTVYSSTHCDSILVINLQISNGVNPDTAKVQACDTYSPLGSQKQFTSSGLFTDTVSSFSGCDSIVNFELTMSYSSHFRFSSTNCGPYRLPSGKMATSTKIYLDTISNNAGCDSVITADLIIHPTYNQSKKVTTYCDYASPSTRNFWTKSGSYIDTLTTAFGCDSIINIDLTINRLSALVISRGEELIAQNTDANFRWIDCDNELQAIPNATKRSFTPAKGGNYAVVLKKGNCTDTSLCKSVVKANIEEYIHYPITVHPNPFTEQFSIRLPKTDIATVTVYNAVGMPILRIENYTSNKNVEFTEPAGLYFIVVHPEQYETATLRLIKQ